MKKEFRKFIISSLIVLAIVIATDFVLGKTMRILLPNTSNKEDIGKTYFSINEVSTPIVIVGSSRASHHYVSNIIEEKFNLETYNVARDGCFFSYNCCVVNSILDRYCPKFIIWENDINSLYKESNDPLESIYPYYKQNDYVTNLIKERSKFSDILKLNSNLYRYNSIIHKIVMINVLKKSFSDKTIKGYSPLTPKINTELRLKYINNTLNKEISDSKVETLRKTLEKAKQNDVKIIIVDSPKYMLQNPNSQSAEIMKKICNEYDMTFINNTQLSQFLENPEYFNDKTHLNHEGAMVYTYIFVDQINNN